MPIVQLGDLTQLSIGALAVMIEADWPVVTVRTHPAGPYVEAMKSLDTIHDSYGQDEGANMVRYFLGNAGSWQGPNARAIKLELKSRLAER